MTASFLSTLTGSFATPAARTRPSRWSRRPTATTGSTPATSTARSRRRRSATRCAAPAAMGWAGFNCSLPHKVAVIEHLDGLGESAAVIGAVNCAVRRDGRLDRREHRRPGLPRGAADRRRTRPARRWSIFGAGGAARAIAVEAALAGAARDHGRQPRRRARRATLRRRSLRRRARRAEAALVAWDARPTRVPADTDIVVNATSIGLFPDVDARLDARRRLAAAGHGRGRRDPQPAAHAR